jgi:hypothetical protein
MSRPAIAIAVRGLVMLASRAVSAAMVNGHAVRVRARRSLSVSPGPPDGAALAAGVVDDLAGDETGVRGGEEGDQSGRVRGLPDPAQGER